MKSQMESRLCNDCCKKFRIYVQYLVGKAHTMNALDFSILKVCCLCLGAWTATVFSKTAKKCKGLLFIGFLASWGYLIWRLFFQETTENDL